MKQSKLHVSLIVLLSVFLVGFVLVDSRDEQLIEIAGEYQSYKQEVDFSRYVKDSSVYEWTIALCSDVGGGSKQFKYEFKHDSTFISNADAKYAPHGNKLYKLFIKDRSSYGNITLTQPVGQTLVKETWNVEEVHKDSVGLFYDAKQSKNDSKWYRPTTVSQLFIMFKEEPDETNDEGWIYGIVDIENGGPPKVLDQGKISSCIGCHKNTKYDRLFGKKRY
jgi:carboxylesterase type B